MKLEDIWEHHRYEYHYICQCGKKCTVLTQRNNSPEYDTEIFVLCDCGEYVPFVLPVN